MATNKRKESAALFELIGKSTLKVPKNAGSLKIPNWWSSKTNPATEGTGAGAGSESKETTHKENGSRAANGHAAAPVAPAARPIVRPQPAVPAAAPVPVPTNGSGAKEHPAQARLFEPPAVSAAGVAPSISPSIRPPAPFSHSAPSVQGNGAGLPVAEVATEAPAVEPPVRETAPIAEEELEGEEPAPRVFAPNTAAKSGVPRGWSPPRAGSFARVPGWVLGAAIGGVVLIVCLIVFMIYRSNKSAAAPTTASHVNPSNINSNRTPPVQGAQGTGGRGGSLIPPPVQQGTGQPRGTANPPGGSVAGDGAGVGHVFEPGTIVRTSDLLYVVIASTPSADVARRNAEFIAARGVSVSIETRYSNNALIYTLVSVEGRPTAEAAEPLRARIVEIGHQTPDYRKGKRAWDDAYVFRVIRPAAPAGQ